MIIIQSQLEAIKKGWADTFQTSGNGECRGYENDVDESCYVDDCCNDLSYEEVYEDIIENDLEIVHFQML